MRLDKAAYDARIRALTTNEHFQTLGFGRRDGGIYFLLTTSPRRILTLKGRQFSLARLLNLAPLDFWRERFPTVRNAKGSFDELSAVDAMFRACERAGEFDELSSEVED